MVLPGCAVRLDPNEHDTKAETALDYSGHDYPNEEYYQTKLADPSVLSNGGRSFAVEFPPADWSWREFSGLVENDLMEFDVRGFDISDQDLSIIDNVNDLTFNNDTVWPEKLPEGFDPEFFLENNKNPGLGIRALHEQGITGEGVGIAIIDQGLYLDHSEYKDNLMFYEHIHCADGGAQMHGPAVASIAVGKNTGVAPGSKLYYIAETHAHFFDDGSYEFDGTIIADSINRILEVNSYLPEGEKIRVISISRGYMEEDKGYNELNAAIELAEAENILVLTTSSPFIFGMSKDYGADPDDFSSYSPAGWVADAFYANQTSFDDMVMFPMSRTYAASTGPDDYELSYQGGMSWAVPWCAGLYALCCQVNPDITPQEFIKALQDTGVTTEIANNGQTYQFGKIVNPAGVIEAIR